MDVPVLFRVIYDPYGGWSEDAGSALVVTDAASFAIAREAVEAQKAGERSAPLTILVRARPFLGGFHDLSLFGPMVKITSIAPREEIRQRYGVPVPALLSDADLIAVGIRGPDDLETAAGPQRIHDQISLEDAVLAKAFGTSVFGQSGPDGPSWLHLLLDFLYAQGTDDRATWAVKPVQQLAEERVRTALQRHNLGDLGGFASSLLKRAAEGTAAPFLEQLTVRFWLALYPRLARKAVVDNMPERVGRWAEVRGETPVLDAMAPWCESLYRQCDHPLCERVEAVLALLLDELIEEEDALRFFGRTTGRFAAEYDAAQERLGKLLLQKALAGNADSQRAVLSDCVARLNAHFAPLREKAGEHPQKASWMESLLEFADLVRYLDLAPPAHWPDWLASYELLLKARNARRSLGEAIPGAVREAWEGLESRFAKLDQRLNDGFAGWLLEEYPAAASGKAESPRLVMHAARIALDRVAHGDRVILLVVDALDWELWRDLRAEFGRAGFAVQGSEAGLAMLPPITEFSRRSILAGLTPRDLAGFVDDIYGTEIPGQEEAKTLARALGHLGRLSELKQLRTNPHIQVLPGELVYANGSSSDLRKALELDARCYALVYTEIDAHIHVSGLSEDKLKDSLRQWLTDLSKELVEGIRHNRTLADDPRLSIIVTSDHGFLNVSGQHPVEWDPSLKAYLDLERHGRLAIVRARADGEEHCAASALEAARAFCEQHSSQWHVLWREDGERYGLADSSRSEGTVLAWLMPRFPGYVVRGRGSYTHGGPSMYEMIVPLAVLTRGVAGVEAPVLTLSGQLASEEEGVLSIALLNMDDRPLHGLFISLPDWGIVRLPLGDVGAGQMKKLDAPLTAAHSGDIAIRVQVDGEAGGLALSFEQMRVVNVQPGRRERMRMSTRRTFDDEEW